MRNPGEHCGVISEDRPIRLATLALGRLAPMGDDRSQLRASPVRSPLALFAGCYQLTPPLTAVCPYTTPYQSPGYRMRLLAMSYAETDQKPGSLDCARDDEVEGEFYESGIGSRLQKPATRHLLLISHPGAKLATRASSTHGSDGKPGECRH